MVEAGQMEMGKADEAATGESPTWIMSRDSVKANKER